MKFGLSKILVVGIWVVENWIVGTRMVGIWVVGIWLDGIWVFEIWIATYQLKGFKLLLDFYRMVKTFYSLENF